MEKLKEGLSPTFYIVQIFLYFDLNIKLKLSNKIIKFKVDIKIINFAVRLLKLTVHFFVEMNCNLELF